MVEVALLLPITVELVVESGLGGNLVNVVVALVFTPVVVTVTVINLSTLSNTLHTLWVTHDLFYFN